MTDANSISAAPFVAILAPYINVAVTALVGAAVTWFVALVHRWTGKDMASADQAKLRQAAQDAAGLVFANAEAGISSVSIHSSDPRIASAAAKVVALEPAIASLSGFTPDAFAHIVTAELGRLQAQAQVVPSDAPAIAVVPAGTDAAAAGAVVFSAPKA